MRLSPIKVSEPQADAISKGVFLIGLGILFYTNAWWPGILLVILATMLSRFYFLGRLNEVVFTIVGIAALWAISYYAVSQRFIVPSLLVLLGAGIIYKELKWGNKS